MNVLMIEYETKKAQKIIDLLYQLDDSIQVVAITDNMHSAAEWLTKNKMPDLILANEKIMADAEKAGGRKIKAVVTFSTFTEKYNFAAFRHKTMRRLLNTIPEQGRQSLSLDKYRESAEKPVTAGAFKERFLVKQGQRLLSIPVTQIAYFFSEERFIFLKTFDNQKFLIEYRMEKLENLLSPALFFRINRSYIISLPTVKEIHSYFGNRLKLYLTPLPDDEIIVSRKRISDFKNWLGK